MYWCSSAEAEKLVKSIEDAYEKVSRIGPNPINTINSKKEIETAPIE
jgi:coenzyme F420-reducing hydrogenase delta subunit